MMNDVSRMLLIWDTTRCFNVTIAFGPYRQIETFRCLLIAGRPESFARWSFSSISFSSALIVRPKLIS